mmetsp:Transcript_12190/g.28431  ORF Transcript_12190/g.28431 Transcript_12190/m.28431 type:complete len:328 (-) Transcript_12190:86-1069(-)|eukprot:CAMPEP_0178429160 /NCGR_PEP_ID=MMETSP0689_2-20121128/30657_1 /TAXON_ID=160604 /ORGANISM="Amphidinium massartii, Strain CS-259" /LENGTH=327 /DNA_ID=CAMNT_0020050969 /DNA_START=30 /DNA_END=1013 /DNA_ORIENTATION=+
MADTEPDSKKRKVQDGSFCNSSVRRTLPPACPAFQWSADFDPKSEAVQKAWEQDGFIIVKGLLVGTELARLQEAIAADGGILDKAYGRDDGSGRKTRLAMWNHPGNDVTGMIARVPKVAGTMGGLLGGDVYHYHTKLMMKDAHTGGAHVWHQDYGYWSNNGCLFPDMGTVFIPLDHMDSGNAGLQVLRGSHKMGLIPHHQTGGQAEVEPKRRAWAMNSPAFEHVYLEMAPGDALFFHSLLLHASSQNHSDRRRWCFLVAFNRVDNDPCIEHHHPRYTPLELAPSNDAITDTATPLVDTNADAKDYIDPNRDTAVKRLKETGLKVQVH